MNAWGFDEYEEMGVTEEDYRSAWVVIGALALASFLSIASFAMNLLS